MMENDDKLISQFMQANKHEIEDNGFSRRVIRQLPEHAKWMSDALTAVCTVLCCIRSSTSRQFPINCVLLQSVK